MEAALYFLIGTISASSLFFGVFLSFLTKEELSKGRTSFIFLELAIIGLIIFIVLSSFNVHSFLAIAFSLLIFGLFFYTSYLRNSFLYYCLLGMLFFTVSYQTDSLLMISTLIFFFGLLQTSLMYSKFQHSMRTLRYSTTLFLLFLFSMGTPYFFVSL